MKWLITILFLITSCAPMTWQKQRSPASTLNNDMCVEIFNSYVEATALTPFEKRTQVLFEKMLDKKSDISYQQLMRLEKQADLFELLEATNLKYGLPEIDFVNWIKDHKEKDLKALLKIFKKFESEKNISPRDVEKMTVKMYRLLNGYRPIYKKIPFYSALSDMLKNSSDDQILEALRTKIWIDALNDHVKTMGRSKNNSVLQKIMSSQNRWNNQIKISLAAILEGAQYSFLGELIPIYVPGVKFFDYKKVTNEILQSVEKNGWQNTRSILEKHFKKSIELDRYYNLLTYTYNQAVWMYLATSTSIFAYDYYQEQKSKKEEMEKMQGELEELFGGLEGQLDDLLIQKTPEEQADDFAKNLKDAGLSEEEIQRLRQKYLDEAVK